MAEELEIIRANLLPAAGTITDNDMILIIQGGRPKRALPSAMKGKQGDPGLSVFLGVNDKDILWKQGANGAWNNLLEIEKLRGPKGEKPVFRKLNGTLQMKYEGEPDSAYVNIFDREDLKMKFSDLTPAEVDQLKLHFSDLTETDKAELMKPATDAAKEVREKMDVITGEANTLKTDLRQLETTVEEQEELRKTSYTLWQSAEQARQGDELKRKEAETGRSAAEELRNQAETERINTESARGEAESSRVLAEGLRVDEEAGRAAAELIRMQSEQGRVTEERKRTEEEKKRVAAETLRDQSEKGRDNAEGRRNQAETLRVSDEVDRDTAEQGRIIKEAERAGAERKRISDETARIGREDDRIVEEQLRKKAELARKEAETGRVTAEEERGRNTVQAIIDTKEASEDANTAADRANRAAEAAEGLVKGFHSDWSVTDPVSPNYIKNKPEIPTLETVPTAETLGYVNTDGTTISYRIGDEVRVLEEDEYVFYRLYDLADGVASWRESGSGTALPGNVYLQGANYYNKSIIRIKEGFINE